MNEVIFLRPENDPIDERYVVPVECRKCSSHGYEWTDPAAAQQRGEVLRDIATGLILRTVAEMENAKKKICPACEGHGHVLMIHQGYTCSIRGRHTIWPEPCPDNPGCCTPLWTIEKELYESKIAALQAIT